MATGQLTPLLGRLQRATLRRDGAGLSDVCLLDQFVRRHDEAAFAALVKRHGPMVMGVCLRALRHRQDAEDAFQATFLVLVRKAASLRFGNQLANWLYGVAYHMALKVRTAGARRRAREGCIESVPEPATACREGWDDVRPLLDREMSRLPDKYRIPILLCDVQNKTRREAAAQLGWPEGTLSGRLSRARAMLAKRLTRRGVALTGGALAVALSRSELLARVPAELTSSTVDYGTLWAAGHSRELIPPRVTALIQGGMEPMRWTRGKAILAIMGLCVAGLTALSYLTAAAGEVEKPAPAKAAQDRPPQKRPLPPVPKANQEQIQIQVELVEVTPNGETRCLARPTLVTLPGQKAEFLAGGELPVRKGDDVKRVEYIPYGIISTIAVHKLRNGKLRLEGTFERSERNMDERADEDNLVLRKWVVQLFSTVRWGDEVTVNFDGREGMNPLRVRLTVNHYEPAPARK
jgi:RNA polymerase sigma factor (sigma-70 family)